MFSTVYFIGVPYSEIFNLYDLQLPALWLEETSEISENPTTMLMGGLFPGVEDNMSWTSTHSHRIGDSRGLAVNQGHFPEWHFTQTIKPLRKHKEYKNRVK